MPGRFASSHSASIGRSNSRVSPSSDVSPDRTICGRAPGSDSIASAARLSCIASRTVSPISGASSSSSVRESTIGAGGAASVANSISPRSSTSSASRTTCARAAALRSASSDAASRRRRASSAPARLSRAITFLIDSRISSTDASPPCAIISPICLNPFSCPYLSRIGKAIIRRAAIAGRLLRRGRECQRFWSISRQLGGRGPNPRTWCRPGQR